MDLGWRWAVESDGPGRVKLYLVYRGGKELTTRRGVAEAFAKLWLSSLLAFLPEVRAVKRARDL